MIALSIIFVIGQIIGWILVIGFFILFLMVMATIFKITFHYDEID